MDYEQYVANHVGGKGANIETLSCAFVIVSWMS